MLENFSYSRRRMTEIASVGRHELQSKIDMMTHATSSRGQIRQFTSFKACPKF